MIQWEYKTIAIKPKSIWSGAFQDNDAMDKILNELGKEGWELVSTFFNSSNFQIVSIFKRPI